MESTVFPSNNSSCGNKHTYEQKLQKQYVVAKLDKSDIQKHNFHTTKIFLTHTQSFILLQTGKKVTNIICKHASRNRTYYSSNILPSHLFELLRLLLAFLLLSFYVVVRLLV